ncbi:hypothetical protein BJY21_000678 [Kineosphaera limosa]|uniref:Methyl-accepting chemotaxis protein n=1 Tax=Kineosphaera limosa NBRC 100340 TaxID=1184609 RepID=K6VN21_9MICO|nr:hypothetical protein [Kineosphaera limosa]NYD99493.1 hypothetical protein [Kineosphaera limosa]GAB97623.1 hypothetical protein KILIM_076_00080 [Kineosphaera limosa NBRC 100340]
MSAAVDRQSSLRRFRVRLGLRVQLLVLCLVGLLGMVGLGTVAAVNVERMNAAAQRIDALQALRLAIADVRYANTDVAGWQGFYAWDVAAKGVAQAFDPTEGYNRAGYVEAATSAEEAIAAVPTDEFTDEADRQRWQRVRDGFDMLFAADAEAVAAYRQDTPASIARGNDLLNDADLEGSAAQAFELVDTAGLELMASMHQRVEAAKEDAAATLRTTYLQIGVALLVFLALLIAAWWRVSRRLLTGISAILAAVRAMGRGDLTVEAGVRAATSSGRCLAPQTPLGTKCSKSSKRCRARAPRCRHPGRSCCRYRTAWARARPRRPISSPRRAPPPWRCRPACRR